MGLILDSINWLVHVPVIEDYVWYAYWFVVGLFSPFVAMLILLYDHTSGYILCLFHKPVKEGQAVLITGCDSGFGKGLAVRLAKRGFKVYAACLTPKGVTDIRREHPAIIGLQLDVTKPDQVQAVADQIDAENPSGLYGLVNNAGIARSGMIDWMSVDDFRLCMEVNFLAVVSVTKIFLPLLKRSKGRILIMSSAAALACGIPVASAYSCSKHAVNVFASALRQELKPWGISVITLNPGFHRTEINNSAGPIARRAWERLDQKTKSEYGEHYVEAVVESMEGFTIQNALDPIHVVNAYEQAMTARWPRPQYRVGIDAKYMFPWLQLPPLRISELLTYYGSTSPGMRRVNGVSAARQQPGQANKAAAYSRGPGMMGA